MNGIAYTRTGGNLRERGCAPRERLQPSAGPGSARGPGCSAARPRPRTGSPRRVGRPAPAPGIRCCGRRGEARLWGTLGTSHGITGAQPKAGVLVRWGRCWRIALGADAGGTGRVHTTHRFMASSFKAIGKPSLTHGVPGRHRAPGACPWSPGLGGLPEHLEVFAFLRAPPPRLPVVCPAAETGWGQSRAQGSGKRPPAPSPDPGAERGDGRRPHRSSWDDEQSRYSPGLPAGLTPKAKPLCAAEKLLIRPPWLLLRPSPVHPDLTSSRRARASPRRLRAPLRSLQRLVRLRADTSASPKDTGDSRAGEEGKQQQKHGLALSFTYLLGGQIACGRWAPALQTGIFIRRAARRSCAACAAKSFLPRHKAQRRLCSAASERPAQRSAPSRAAGPRRRAPRSPALAVQTALAPGASRPSPRTPRPRQLPQ